MYLLHGKLSAKTGHAGDLARILIEASQLVASAPGCKLYVIGEDEKEPDSVYVTEIWDNKEAHDLSLKNEDVRTLVMKALPFLEGQPQKGQELTLLGGHGIQV